MKIWKYVKIVSLGLVATTALVGAVCAPNVQGMFMCLSLTVLVGFWATVEYYLDGI